MYNDQTSRPYCSHGPKKTCDKKIGKKAAGRVENPGLFILLLFIHDGESSVRYQIKYLSRFPPPFPLLAYYYITGQFPVFMVNKKSNYLDWPQNL